MASPARQPARKPQPPARKPVRRPPERRKPPADRPGRRKPDPRAKPPVKKPAPKLPKPRPLPADPLWAKPPKRPSQFGRRFPVIGKPPVRMPFPLWKALRFGGPLGFFLPYVLPLGDPSIDMGASGWQLCCRLTGSNPNAYKVIQDSVPTANQPYMGGNPMDDRCVSTYAPCGTNLQVPDGVWPTDIPFPPAVVSPTGSCAVRAQYLFLGTSNQGVRMNFTEVWWRIVPWTTVCADQYTPAPGPVMVPGDIPVQIPSLPPLPQWVDPLPLPDSPMPLPIPKPLHWPDPVPNPEENPQPQPKPEPIRVRPPGQKPGVPSLDLPLTPGATPSPRPDWHVKEPPGPGDKEKKKRLSPSQSRAWLETLVGSYTELDDAVAAIYRALPWQVRRWRGRDGVWRERDHTTKLRLERIYSEIGNLSVKKAVDNLIKEYLTDMAFGKVGNAMKKQIRKLADDGLYVGSQGLGGQRYTKTWEEAEKLLKKRAADEGNLHARIIRTRHYNRETGEWETREQYAPRTQIPWMRQKSNYPRQPRPGEVEYWELTKAERERNARTVDRSYYAKRPSRNDVYDDTESNWPGYRPYRHFYR